MGQGDFDLLVRDVRNGRLSRRDAIARLVALGMSAGGISAVLASAAPQPVRAAPAGARGSSGVLKLLYWQAP
ncbi:MAG TPA: peptide ABC transporter substrate-binding protein, partial [bacterium]|nr:peptide ABC transporter substrate-binding protein [bacterium]